MGSERKPALTIRDRLAARERELRSFIETTHALASVRDPQAVLRIIFDKAKALVRCAAWTLFVIDPATQELVFDMIGGPKARRLKGLRIKPGRGIVGWVAQHGRATLIADAPKDPRFLSEIDQVTAFKTRTILCVPILARKRLVAVLEMLNKVGQPFDRQDLTRLSRLLEQASIALERASLFEEMTSLGVTDELTKLFNGRYLQQSLDREISRCRRYGSVMALIFLDLDRFKRINDCHGHLMGSQCLTEVAQIMASSVRDVDVLARYGGDEFMVVLPEATVATARMVAGRLHEALGKHVFLEAAGIKARLTVSIGIAGFPGHAQTKEDLIRKADEAMYQAKAAGRNRICTAE
jgi:diguanylate cyclase (GGDEF)-like protein